MECCRDCNCWKKDEICNLEKNECEKAEVKISDDEVKRLVTDYYKNQTKTLASLDIIGPLVWRRKIGKEVRVNVKSQDYFEVIFVGENKAVTEIKKP